jgi:adenine nucleotide transporter 17
MWLWFSGFCFHSEVKCFSNSGTWDAIIKMIRYEGFNGFYKGMGTKIVQSVLAAAVLFMVKEELVKQTRFLLSKPKLV